MLDCMAGLSFPNQKEATTFASKVRSLIPNSLTDTFKSESDSASGFAGFMEKAKKLVGPRELKIGAVQSVSIINLLLTFANSFSLYPKNNFLNNF